MGIISWVQFTQREGFVWGGLTRIHFWKSVKGVLAGDETSPNNFKYMILIWNFSLIIRQPPLHTFPKMYPC